MLYLLFDITYTIIKTTVNGVVYLVTPAKRDIQGELVVTLVEENSTLVEENLRLQNEIENLKKQK